MREKILCQEKRAYDESRVQMDSMASSGSPRDPGWRRGVDCGESKESQLMKTFVPHSGQLGLFLDANGESLEDL